MTEYDDFVMYNGKLHPLSGIPQESLDAAVRELRASNVLVDAGWNDPVEAESLAHGILAAAMTALDLQARVDEAWEDGAEAMRLTVERLMEVPIPKIQEELF